MTDPLFSAIAVDGGGTHCRLALLGPGYCETVVADAANASSDFDATVQSINSGLQLLLQRSALPEKQFYALPAYLGLAGVVDKTIAHSLQQSLPLEKTRIEDDRPAALCGALQQQDGLLAHCGTGSFFAAQRQRQQTFAGGWGWILDDIASACWLGKRALTQALYTSDGLIEHSQLSKQLLQQYGQPAKIVEFASTANASDFGRIATLVTSLAKQQDQVAVNLMQEGANYIAGYLRGMNWKPADAICLTGGLGPRYAGYLPQDMQQVLIKPKGSPLEGAIAMALDFADSFSY